MGQDHIEFIFDDAKATIIQRGEERDQPDGERTIPRCVTAFNAITGHKLSNCDGWMFMEVLKQCRSVQGSYKYDDYRDRIGYAALAAEEARLEEEARVAPAPALVEASEYYKAAIACGDLIIAPSARGYAECECAACALIEREPFVPPPGRVRPLTEAERQGRFTPMSETELQQYDRFGTDAKERGRRDG